MVTTTKTEKQTISLGRRIGKALNGGEILLLEGELGAGKTTLVKGVAQSLGVKHPITSPTFLMLKHYEGKDGMTFVHIDGYRLKHSVDSTTVGIHEYLGKPDTVCVIEWPKRIMLPKRLKNIRTISMHHGNNQTRRITY